MAIDQSKVEAVLNQARRSPASLRYFYDQLRSPDWIEPLRALGVFRTPAPVLREEGYISFSEWPESKYLARMAEFAPRAVRGIILEVPSTENMSVHQDFISAALKMPAGLSIAIANTEAKWIQSQPVLNGQYPILAGELVRHLASGGQHGVALNLARVLLEIGPDARTTREDYPFSPEPAAKFDNWHFARILESDIEGGLLPVAPMDTLQLVADLLQSAVEVRQTNSERPAEHKEDYSRIWRPTIEHEHSQNIKQTLVTGVRNIAIRIAELGAEQQAAVLEELRKRTWTVFERLATYVTAVSPNTTVETLESFILEKRNFERQGLNREFDLLLKNGFGRVQEDARRVVFGIVDQGPNQAAITEMHKQVTGRELTQAEYERYADLWRLSWLTLLSDQLTSTDREKYDALTAKYGNVPIEPKAQGGWIGPTSPVPATDLQEMPIPELVAYLGSFRANNDWTSPSPEGLSRTLSAVVASNPARFAGVASEFSPLHPTYIRGLVSGFRTALKEGKRFEWPDVLSLCRQSVEQQRDVVEPLGHDADPDWGWARREIAALLGEGLANNSVGIEYKADIWNIIQVLVEDPDPSPEREVSYIGSQRFPAMLALNSVRGAALEAAIHYALWLDHNGIRSLDEVGPVLNRHLDLGVDPSYAVREVCGRLFPWLAKLDENWAKNRMPVIFPPEQADQRWIAWENYILFCCPYDSVLQLLEGEYSWAITQIGEVRGKEGGDADSHLAEHLMAFYWRGKLSLNGEILTEFFARAPENLRQHALEFVGRSLGQNTATPIPAEILSRLRALWESRLGCARTADTQKELAAFGWWFTSGRFDETWRCEQLIAALNMSGSIEPDWEVVKSLVPLATTRPLFVLEALHLIIEADRQSWGIYGWQKEADQILYATLALRDQNVSIAAKAVVDLLVAKGHFQYRRLLKAQFSGDTGERDPNPCA